MNRFDLIIDALENSEPTRWVYVYEQKHQVALAAARELKALEQPEQWTPVEIGVDVTPDGAHVVGMYVLMPEAVRHVFYSQFHPAPKREWVGLTNEEVDECNKLGLRDDVYKAIEATLRSKNT